MIRAKPGEVVNNYAAWSSLLYPACALRSKYNLSSLRASEDNLFAQAWHFSFTKESPFEWILRPRGFYEDSGSSHQTSGWKT